MKTTTYPRPQGNPLVFAVVTLVTGGIFFWAMSSTLTDMTRNDCNAGIQQACQALAK